MDYEIRIERLDSQPLAVVCRRAQPHELAKVVPDACGTVWGVVRGQQLTGAGRHVAVYLDNQINLEVGVELTGSFGGYGDVVSSSTPAGEAATTTHYGPYGQLPLAHEAIQQWCRRHGRSLAGPCWEIYGHWIEAWNSNPSMIRTDVFYLLAAGTSTIS